MTRFGWCCNEIEGMINAQLIIGLNYGKLSQIARKRTDPGELKFALTGYYQAVEELKPALPPPFQARYTFWLEQLLKEASDEQAEFHWWETMLELIPQQVVLLGASSQTLQEAGSQLKPLMRRHLGPYEGVSLREIGEDTVLRVCFLSDTLAEPQKYMVAPNAISLAQALVNPKAWYRAIYAGKALVGFIMLSTMRRRRIISCGAS